MKLLLASLAMCLTVLPTTLLALDQVEWPDLIDPASQDFDDPFRDLDEDQIDLLRVIIRARKSLEQGVVPQESVPETEARLEAALATLEQVGIDADWLISQRWVIKEKRIAAAIAGNPDLDAKMVMIAGYAIPAPPDVDGRPTAYLVEIAGMCSHIPTPLPNQMIRLRLNDDWAPAYMHQPVRVTGSLSIDPSDQSFRVVDGDVAMKATWALDVQAAEAFVPKPTADGSTSSWADQMRAKLRSGN